MVFLVAEGEGWCIVHCGPRKRASRGFHRLLRDPPTQMKMSDIHELRHKGMELAIGGDIPLCLT